MTALIIILSILAFFAIIGLLRVGVRAEYSSDGFELTAMAGPVRINLIPGSDKPKKEKENKKSKKSKPKKDKNKKKDKKTEKKDKLGGTIKKVKAVIPTLVKTLGRFLARISVDELTVHYTVTGDDPCKTALTFGYASAALGFLQPLISRMKNIKKFDVKLNPCFTDCDDTVYIKAQARIAIWKIVYVVLKIDFKAIISIL